MDGEGDGKLERRVSELEEQVADMFAGNGAVKLFIDPTTGAIVSANPAAARFYGYSIAELQTMRVMDLNQLPAELIERELARAQSEQRTYFEFKHRLKSGQLRDVQVYSGPCRVDGRNLLFSVICDITERNRLAEDLALAQRMEALGRLAGGVAHDLNNLLTTFEMLRALIERKISRSRPVGAELSELKNAVARGAGLTAQLLAFCRRQPLAPVLLDAGGIVRGMEDLLRRVRGDRIELCIETDGPAPVVGDRSQLEQVILNLAINATDAMPTGGRLTVGVRPVNRHDDCAALRGPMSGRWIEILVQDTGVGIPADLHERIFEPFFTTKPAGRGTGLGLATVYGIARQAGGSVTVDSAPGAGATFRVWLPRAVHEDAPLPSGTGARRATGGHETILLCEDDEASRQAIRGLLEDHGYRVLEAGDGQAALDVAEAYADPIDLLLTDVVMPVMGGPELARALARVQSTIHVLYMSGYVDSPLVDHGLLDASERLLAKPFALDDLLRMVRSVLDGPIRARGVTEPG